MADRRRRWWEVFQRRDVVHPRDVLKVSRAVAQQTQHEITTPESGVSGTSVLGGKIDREDYNPELTGLTWFNKIQEMRRGDAQVRAALQVIKLPLRAGVWEAVPPERHDAIDDAIADMVQANIFDDDGMDDMWDFVLRHILLQLDYGFMVMEKVWKVGPDGTYQLRRLGPRMPRTINAWELDRSGRINAVWQWAPVIQPVDPRRIAATTHPAVLPSLPSVTWQHLRITGDAVAVFTHEREGDNHEGTSILRSAYKHWRYKDLIYHLEGVRLDRYGVGIPSAELDAGHSLNQAGLDALEEVLKNLRANEQMFLIEPPGVRIKIKVPEGGSRGGATGTVELIDHHDSMIARNVLAGFLTMGRDPRGTLGFGSRLTDLFVSGLYGVAQGICADLKRQVVRQLCDLNFDMTKREYPSVRVRDLEQVDLERITSLLMQLAGGPLITPDDSLEEALRKSLRLAPLPENLRRDKQKPASATGAAMGPAAAAASAAALPPVEEPADEELGVTGVVPPDEDEGDLNPA